MKSECLECKYYKESRSKSCGSCSSCEHYNLHYHNDEHVSTRGTWGECMYPHRMNIDDITELREKEEKGIVKRVRVEGNHICRYYMDKCCYGGR